jgi:hypothetical protein
VCVQVEQNKLNEFRNMLPNSVSIFPYFGDRVLLVAASLNGGNVLDKLIDVVLNWNQQLGFTNEIEKTERDTVWTRLIELAQNIPIEPTQNSLECLPTIFGERHDKQTYAILKNIRHCNITSLGSVFDAICKGIILNLSTMIGIEFLKTHLKCRRVIATGSGFARNPIMKKHLENVFHDFEIDYKTTNDAAIGAAYFLKHLYDK